VLIFEYKVAGNKQQTTAIDEAIRITQFVRNKCLRLWMDEPGHSKNDLQCYCTQLAKEYPFASCLNSQARQVSRKQKKSKNRQKARKHLAKAHLKVQRQREDFARKTANTLASSHDLIAFEHLQIRNMVKNHQLAKSIHDAAWGRFLGWVKAYAGMHGIEVVAVPPHYTSQNCSGCGERVEKTLSTTTHVCPTCGLVLDRDENAALNILTAALEVPWGTGKPMSDSHKTLGER
jgi:IS605 OrfB family transposase